MAGCDARKRDASLCFCPRLAMWMCWAVFAQNFFACGAPKKEGPTALAARPRPLTEERMVRLPMTVQAATMRVHAIPL